VPDEFDCPSGFTRVLPERTLVLSGQFWTSSTCGNGRRSSGHWLWFAVNKVIHHDNVSFRIIVPARRRGARFDANARDDRLVEHDTQKGEASIARRAGDGTAEQPLVIGIKELYERAGLKVCAFARPVSPRLVNVCENCAEATH
jgi:hypothetical protein